MKLAENPGAGGMEAEQGFVRSDVHLGIGRNPVIRVLLLHGAQIPHYRVPLYNHLSHYLGERSFALTVACEGIQPGNPTPSEFEFVTMHLSVGSIARLRWRGNSDVATMFVDLRHF